MKMDPKDFFEIFSDIDENLVNKARRSADEYTAEPVRIVTTSKTEFPWKKIAAAAASLALVGGIGVFAWSNMNSVQSLSSANENESNIVMTKEIATEAVETSDTAGDGVITNTIPKISLPFPQFLYLADSPTDAVQCAYTAPKIANKKYDTYSSLADDSLLIVSGTFTENAYQDYDPAAKSAPNAETQLFSMNKLQINRVIKGENFVSEGDFIYVVQPYSIYGNKMYTSSLLTPMVKGDTWIYFLKRYSNSDTVYSPVGDSFGRYTDPLCETQNSYFSFDKINNGLIAEEENEERTNIESYLSEICYPDSLFFWTCRINYLDDNYSSEMWDDSQLFEMPEFPGIVFKWTSEAIYMTTSDSTEELYWGMPIWDLYLCDLNGDGKRELCSSVSFGSGMVDERIVVYDVENRQQYELSDRGYFDYKISLSYSSLSSDSSALYYQKKEYNGENEEYGILSLDICKSVEYSITNNDHSTDTNAEVNEVWREDFPTDDTYVQFRLDEFKGLFTLDGKNSTVTFVAADEIEVTIFSGDRITCLYLWDVNGDGKRELCSNVIENDKNKVMVYDVENHIKHIMYSTSDTEKELVLSFDPDKPNELTLLTMNGEKVVAMQNLADIIEAGNPEMEIVADDKPDFVDFVIDKDKINAF